MSANFVRLTQLEIQNVKNVCYGLIDLAGAENCANKKGGIFGIYGQNGSGKTVVVDCMALLKCLLSGRQIPPAFCQYIRLQSETAKVRYCFQIRTDGAESYAEYVAELWRTGENRFIINREKLSAKAIDNTARTKLTPLFEYRKGKKELFTPLAYYRLFAKKLESIVALNVAQQYSENFNEEKQRPEVSSFLFSRKAQEVFSQAGKEAEKLYTLTNILQFFGMNELAVVENSHYGLLALNLDSLPLNIDWPEHIKSHTAGLMVKMTGVNVMPKGVYPYFARTIEQVNLVLKSLVPEVELEIHNAFDKLMGDGQEGVQFELITRRDGIRIPLLHESAGIKKIISICSNLVACYNRESYCLVVDELDSGVYEYLLGEYLEAMQEKARGQFLFTSHNLRPLEVLEPENLIFTTVNPDARYIKNIPVKGAQNARLSYLRAVKLGGRKEKLYHDTNIYEIEQAMRKAGRVELHD